MEVSAPNYPYWLVLLSAQRGHSMNLPHVTVERKCDKMSSNTEVEYGCQQPPQVKVEIAVTRTAVYGEIGVPNWAKIEEIS